MTTATLSTTDDKISNTLLRDAFHHTPVSNARVVAGLARRGKLVCRGRNLRKSHPLQARFGRNPDAIFFHAEINCIVEAERQDIEIAGLQMYVVRSLSDGSPGLSMPCEGCMDALRYFNVSEVVYSDYEGMQSLELNDE